MSAIERVGNLWQEPRSHEQVTVVTTNGFVKNNGEAVMGRGIAQQCKRTYPGIEFKLGELLGEHGNRPFILAPGVWTLPTKHVWWEASDPNLIVQGIDTMYGMTERRAHQIDVIRFPRPGCGNGGLQWDYVKPLIWDRLDNYPVEVEIWSWK